MKKAVILLTSVLLFMSLPFLADGEEYQLLHYLARLSSKMEDLTKQEKEELLTGIEDIMERIQRNHNRLTSVILSGEMDLRYQEGKFWMSKAEEDLKSIEVGVQQVKLLKEKPGDLVAAVVLYKSLKDLSLNLAAFNNVPSFTSFVGDLAPEVVLWADPVFYQLYLLPLAQSKNVEVKPPKVEKKATPKKK